MYKFKFFTQLNYEDYSEIRCSVCGQYAFDGIGKCMNCGNYIGW